MKTILKTGLFVLCYYAVIGQQPVRISDRKANHSPSIGGKSEFQSESNPKVNETLPFHLKSTNGNCGSASLLTEDVPQCYNFSTDSYQTGETSCVDCLFYGYNFRTIWYVMQASSNQTTINFNTNEDYWFDTYSVDNIAVYGPYTSQANATANCIPPVSQQILCIDNYVFNYDPLFSYSLPTNSGSYYLVQITNCEDSWDLYWHTGCMWFNATPPNDNNSNPSVISDCGTVFNGSNIGYSPSTVDGLPMNANLDNNNATTCSGCATGVDIPYVINNDSWFRVCASTTSTYNVLFNNISNCINNDGLQMSLLTGTPTALTNIWNASNPSLPGSSQTSPNFTLNTGQCAYLLVDGFSGDQCDYSYTLNAVTPCLVLGATIVSMKVKYTSESNAIEWETENETNLSHYEVLKSNNGIDWTVVETEPAKNSAVRLTYSVEDRHVRAQVNYYKLRMVDFDGTEDFSDIFMIDNTREQQVIDFSVNLLGQRIDPSTFKGIVIDVYKDGTTKKRMQ